MAAGANNWSTDFLYSFVVPSAYKLVISLRTWPGATATTAKK